MEKFIVCIFLVLTVSLPSFALTVETKAPGNVFVAGKQLEFGIKDAQGSVSYKLTDYFGKVVLEDKTAVRNGIGAIRLKGLEPGYYELNCKDDIATAEAYVTVVMDRGNAPLPREGRVCADAASAWLITKEEQRRPFAKMMRLGGIPWVRERLSWTQTQPEPGKIDWAQYQAVADTLSAEGVHICQMWHEAPLWIHPDNPNFLFPKDLRDLYRYSKTVSGHFAGKIQAWEVWNEADIGWALLGDTFAAMQKAEYLGLKAGNPDVLVLQTSFSHVTWNHIRDWGASTIAQNIYESGVDDYFDIFNWHTYLWIDEYPKMMDAYRKLMQKYHFQERPAWLTEVGSAQQGTDGPDKHLLNIDAQRKQCDFVPKSVAMGLMSGTAKYFWFVLPDYMESTNQFGMLRADLVPYPAFSALSAAANILGLAEYVGEYKADGSDVSTYLFSTPKGNVLVAWSDKGADLAIPTEKAKVKIANQFGVVSELTAVDGKINIKADSHVVYLLDIGNAVKAKAENPRPREMTLPKNNPSTVVLAGYCALPFNRGGAVYNLEPGDQPNTGKPFTYTVEVYQFDEKNGAEGTVEVTVPTGWHVEDAKRTVKLDPMGREILKFKVTPLVTGGAITKVTARGKFTSPAVAPTVSFIQ